MQRDSRQGQRDGRGVRVSQNDRRGDAGLSHLCSTRNNSVEHRIKELLNSHLCRSKSNAPSVMSDRVERTNEPAENAMPKPSASSALPTQSSRRPKQKWSCWSYAHVYRNHGKLNKQPCVCCGSRKSQMHHPDYLRPPADRLDVYEPLENAQARLTNFFVGSL